MNAPKPADIRKINAGDSARLTHRFTREEVERFAQLSGDENPMHLDYRFARNTTYQRPVVHGMLVASFVSTLVGMHLPGTGALWSEQSFQWLSPVFVGDTVDFELTVLHRSEAARLLKVAVNGVNQDGVSVLSGEGMVMVMEDGYRVEPDLPISERVALVTGASRGIGAAIARRLASSGAGVVVNYANSKEQAEELCAEIVTAGGRAIALCADVTDPHAVQKMVATAAQHYGKAVDVLVNNASGSIQSAPIMQTSWDQIQAHLDVQVRGAFNCCQAVIPGMVEQESGRIVNIGSIVTAGAPPPNWTGYTLAKAALHSLTRSLAVELAVEGIRVNLVSPGMTETGLISHISAQSRRAQALKTPLGRLCVPDDVARVVTALCSEFGDFLTGIDIPVAGGIVM